MKKSLKPYNLDGNVLNETSFLHSSAEDFYRPSTNHARVNRIKRTILDDENLKMQEYKWQLTNKIVKDKRERDACSSKLHAEKKTGPQIAYNGFSRNSNRQL